MIDEARRAFQTFMHDNENRWQGMQDSNLRHSQSKCDVLPAELIPNKKVAFRTGVEPVWPD